MASILIALATTTSACAAAPAIRLPVVVPLIKADWQEPQALPPRLRNHCATDAVTGRAYCSDDCGFQYQVYSCSPHSFGCCRVGFGYCDWNGWLRCHP
ncbi:MAG: hypothetical protein KGK33_11935 [Hyphomicrobiales bacterium]|nr:hypothetical protein [Hyphomicrobiales bacterium]